jgi:hypothetical protein
MNGVESLLLAASKLEEMLVERRWRFCFIGGVAVQRWGNPRFTQDLDLTLLTGFGEEEDFIDSLLNALRPRRPDARDFALQNRVLLAQTADGIDVDVALGAVPFEERSVVRATSWQLQEGIRLTTCSAEDLIVHKAFAGRGRDWDDLETILIRQHRQLDLAQVRFELQPLLELKGEPESLGRFNQVVVRVDRRLGGLG